MEPITHEIPANQRAPIENTVPAEPAVPVNPATSDRSIFSRRNAALVLAVVLVIAVAIAWHEGMFGGGAKNPNRIVLYGNVDLRQVDLAFNNSERISEVLVQEGDKVVRGQQLARLDTSRLTPQAASAKADMEAQQAAMEKLHHGSRPQEIAQAQANVAAAKADQINTLQQWRRLTALASLTTGRAISQQDIESAKDAMDIAQAHLVVAQKSLDLATIGPRKEDIAEAEALLRVKQAQFSILQQQFADAELVAPSNAVVRSRLLEPGEMSSPQRPVFNLAIVDPKWIRAYLSEADLGKVHGRMKASITSDSFPGRSFAGWVGFISSVAEFTPKTVETVELRSSLVYEIRIFVQDPQDQLRLGMPATVQLDSDPGTNSHP
ncbi:MAG: efflux RND transporter periplasmic adaptor subunit [Burkholderiaceae bacterium]|nr:efflux RND transporter periplasmic adaptor subunit [Burkholderiaceae bacterium]